MRVAISYSTEIENIPTEVTRLLASVQKPDVATQVSNICALINTDNNYINAINEINELRKQLGSLDYRLRDCASIISGYVNEVIKEESNESETDEG